MTTFGEALLALMHAREMSLRQTARASTTDYGYLSKISRDLQKPSLKIAEALETTLEAPGALVPLMPKRDRRRPAPTALPSDPVGTLDEKRSTLDQGEDDVKRREALQLLASLGMAAGALSTGEPVRQLLALTLDSEPRDLDDWHLTISDHLHALRTRPPTQVRDDLVIDLSAIQHQIRTADATQVSDLQRVTAALAMILANTSTRLGDHGSAIRWSRTAKAAADGSGDLELGLLVRCEEAGLGLYGQRDPRAILQLVHKARNIAGDRASSAGMADLAQTEVKALSLLGRHSEAKMGLQKLYQYTPGGSGDGPISSFWLEDQFYFAQSWVYSHAGEEVRADEARNRVLSYGGDYQYAANVRLHEALCTTVRGGVDQGVRQAAEILAALPTAQKSHMIMETGKAVLRAVPNEQVDRPTVRDLRAITTGAAG